MAQTEREAVVQHFHDNKLSFDNTVDLAVYLESDRIGDKKFANGYVDKVLAAGYRSNMTKQLLDDINKTNEPSEEFAEAEKSE